WISSASVIGTSRGGLGEASAARGTLTPATQRRGRTAEIPKRRPETLGSVGRPTRKAGRRRQTGLRTRASATRGGIPRPQARLMHASGDVGRRGPTSHTEDFSVGGVFTPVKEFLPYAPSRRGPPVVRDPRSRRAARARHFRRSRAGAIPGRRGATGR